MLPSPLLFELVDSQVAFSVTKQLVGGQLSVSRPRNGLLRLSDGIDVLEGNATLVLAKLNYLLCQEMVHQLSLKPEYPPHFDAGQIIKTTLTPESAKGKQSRFDEHIHAETVILAASSPLAASRQVVYETTVGRARSLQVASVIEDTISDLMQVSRRAMPQAIHKMVVGMGMSWTGAPDAEESYAKLYGQDALERAVTEQDAADDAYTEAVLRHLKR
jgi:hypothetical protein